MNNDSLIALASLLTALGAAAAAIVAAYALRAQQRSQQRQHDLENLRWMTDQHTALRPLRRRAAASYLDGNVDEEALRDLLNFFENGGYMVREGFITLKTFEQIMKLSVLRWWYTAEDWIHEMRARLGAPELFDHFEWLKDRLDTEDFVHDRDRMIDFLRREADRPALEPTHEREAEKA